MYERTLIHRILGPYRISHHPFCSHFKDHVYDIRGKRICRGCLMQYSGIMSSFMIITLGYFLGLWTGLTEFQVGIVLYFLVLPTIITAFLITNRKIKDIARFLLGTAFTLAFILLVFTPDWLIKGWILLHFIPGYIYLNRRRITKNDEVCSRCEEYSNFPNCTGYQIYTDREKIFMTQELQGGIIDPFALPPDKLDE
ncbi:MAG: hypothetical protein ACFFFH_01020 [Candidatus Thorarchaeota archaeon]